MKAITSKATPAINPSDGRSVPAQSSTKPENELSRITGNIANWTIQSANATGTPNNVSTPG